MSGCKFKVNDIPQSVRDGGCGGCGGVVKSALFVLEFKIILCLKISPVSRQDVLLAC